MNNKKIIEFIEKIAIPFPGEDLTDKELDDFFKEHGDSPDKYYLIPINKLKEVEKEDVKVKGRWGRGYAQRGKEKPIIRAKEALNRLRGRI